MSLVAGKPYVSAQAPSLAGSYELIARHSGKCLGVSGASMDDGAPVIQWTCDGGLNQRWRLQPASDGYYNLVASHSGKLLDVTGVSTDDGAQIIQWPANGGQNQEWLPTSLGGGYYTLTARHSGKVLDISGVSTDDGAPAIQWTPNGGENQQWLLRSASAAGPSAADATRFLEQATWGPTPDLINHVCSVGLEGFLDEQFAAPLSSYPTLPLYPDDA